MPKFTNTDKIQLSTPYGVMRKPIEKMDNDELIFWTFFERDAMVALRNFLPDCPESKKEALELDINETESRYKDYLAAIKDRMRKGGK